MAGTGAAASVDPYPSCLFYVDLGDLRAAVFTELTGLQVEITTTPHEEGGNNGFIHRLPGRANVGNITLKRGLTNFELVEWLMQTASGKIVKRNVTVQMIDTGATARMMLNFKNAFPVKWVGPQFRADSNAAAIESLELAHEGVSLG
jgi:phage tail-like protein